MENDFQKVTRYIQNPIGHTLIKSSKYLQKIINYSQNSGGLLSKFTLKYIAQSISIGRLQQWSQVFGPTNLCSVNSSAPNWLDKKFVSLQQFVALFASQIPHNKNETLYLIISLMEIFSQLLQKSKFKYNSSQLEQQPNDKRNRIEYSSITDYLCQKIIQNTQSSKLQIKSISKCQQISQNLQKTYKSKSPFIKFLFNENIPFINKQNLNKEKSMKSQVNKLIYSEKLDKIICLVAFGKQIQIYDFQFRLKNIIKPLNASKFNFNRQCIIISIAYNDTYGRIGCVVHNIGLVFWQAIDEFQTEKFIQGVKADSIFYLKSIDVWGTIKSNVISIWNIHKQKQMYKLTIPESAQIVCLEEIQPCKQDVYGSKIIISVNFRSTKRQLQLYNISFQKAVFLSKIEIDSLGCHTLHLNQATQSILQVGFNNIVKVWQYDKLTHQLMVVGTLEGHRNIVTSITSVKKSSIVMTGDERGIIKLWDLRHMRCFQTVKLSCKQIKQIMVIDNHLIFGDNRINMIALDYKKDQKGLNCYIKSFFDENNQNLYIFSQNSCNLVNKQSGQIKQIYLICDTDEQLVCCEQLNSFFILGTNKGNIILLDSQFKKKKSIKAHQSSIHRLWIDLKYSLVMSISFDQSLLIWAFDYINFNINLRKSLVNLPGNELSEQGHSLQIQISNLDYIIGMRLHGNQIWIVDLQSLKLFEKLVFPTNVVTYKFHTLYQILVAVTQHNRIYIIQLEKRKNKILVNEVHEVSLFDIFEFTKHQKQGNGQANTQKLCKNGLIIQIVISKNGELICIVDNKSIQIYDLQGLLKQIGICFDNRYVSSQYNFFRSVHEKFTNLKIQIKNCVQNKQIQKLSQQNNVKHLSAKRVKNISSPFVKEHDRIILTQQNQQFNIITLIWSRAILMIIDYNSLQCLCLRKQSSTHGQYWSKISLNKKRLNEKIFESIKLNQRIFTTKFRPEVMKLISFEKLDICGFLSFIISRQSDFINDSKLPSKYNSGSVQNKQRRNHSLLQLRYSKMTLKSMQTEKRVHKNSDMQLIHKKRQLQVKNPIRKLRFSEQKLNQNVLRDKFFRVSANQRLQLHKNEGNEDTCKIYEQINFRYEKWTKNKSRSLSNFSHAPLNSTQGNFIKTSKNIQFTKLKIKQFEEKKDIKQKISRMYSKKDKRTELVKKLLNRQCDDIFKNKKK